MTTPRPRPELRTVVPPDLPAARSTYSRESLEQTLNVLRLFFNQLTNTVNELATPRDFLSLVDGVTPPDAKAGVAFIYVDSADGDLKIKFGDGTVKTIVTD